MSKMLKNKVIVMLTGSSFNSPIMYDVKANFMMTSMEITLVARR